jgi:hypothetical protein
MASAIIILVLLATSVLAFDYRQVMREHRTFDVR